MSVRRSFVAALTAVVIGGCVPVSGVDAPFAPRSPEIEALAERWEGRWTGSWNGECDVAIDVSNVDANSARVEYFWTVCAGNASGSYVNSSAFLSDDVLTMPFGGQTTLTFVYKSEGRLAGTFDRPEAGHVGKSEFRRVGELAERR